ncbi:MAG: hypothetical protein AAF546_11075 [Verrucomicrobiota bacterium]
MKFNLKTTISSGIVLTCLTLSATASINYIDLSGPATGGFNIHNAKNSSTQNGIEGKNPDGSFNSSHNGLPDYANFQIPDGFTNAGVYTAIINSPLDASYDYSNMLNHFYGDPGIQVNNAGNTQPGVSSFSAGRIDYDNSLVTGIGTETVGVSNLTLDFNTFEWDGNINGDGGANGLPTPGPDADNPWVVSGGPYMISPFSPVYTIYNDSSGAGNAAFFYYISASNITGSGLTFVDGVLTSMDISADLEVDLRIGQAPAFGPNTITGSFTASDLEYEFDVKGTKSVAFFTGINLYADRTGTASVVPEPSSFALFAGLICLTIPLIRRRGRRSGSKVNIQ